MGLSVKMGRWGDGDKDGTGGGQSNDLIPAGGCAVLPAWTGRVI